jgi:predicted CoA-binding protein
MNVAVIGASAKPARYSYKAVAALQANRYQVYPVHPVLTEVRGLPVYRNLADIPVALDVITMYIGAARSQELEHDILQARPGLIIFNPGAENEKLATVLERQGIPFLEACTLILLSTGQFEEVCLQKGDAQHD